MPAAQRWRYAEYSIATSISSTVLFTAYGVAERDQVACFGQRGVARASGDVTLDAVGEEKIEPRQPVVRSPKLCRTDDLPGPFVVVGDCARGGSVRVDRGSARGI